MGSKIDYGNLALRGLDDLFSTEEERSARREAQTGERVAYIPLDELHPFKNHPFQVRDDEEMEDLVKNIQENGVLHPVLIRPRAEGGYELISGHRRHHASCLAGLDTIPALIRELDDDAAIIQMVDANKQRETILPSEKAFAYKMRLEAIKHQGMRHDLTSCQVGAKLRTDAQIAADTNESARQIQRFIRLTELIPGLLEMVDQKRLAFNTGVELSYLRLDEQEDLLAAIDYHQSIPSLSQAKRMKALSMGNSLSETLIMGIMGETKKPVERKVELKEAVLKDYFPASMTAGQVRDIILRLLDQYRRSGGENR